MTVTDMRVTDNSDNDMTMVGEGEGVNESDETSARSSALRDPRNADPSAPIEDGISARIEDKGKGAGVSIHV